jgi:hypothetical protein
MYRSDHFNEYFISILHSCAIKGYFFFQKANYKRQIVSYFALSYFVSSYHSVRWTRGKSDHSWISKCRMGRRNASMGRSGSQWYFPTYSGKILTRLTTAVVKLKSTSDFRNIYW